MAKQARANGWLGELTRKWVRRRARSSIRTRVLAIVLIPSIALIATGAAIAGILVNNGLTARNFASYMTEQTDLTVKFAGLVQGEREASLRYLGGDRTAQADLTQRRNDINAALAVMTGSSGTSATAAGLNPNALNAVTAKFVDLLSRLPVVRQSVDVHQASIPDVDTYYTQVAAYIIGGLQAIAANSPDSNSATEETFAADMYAAMDAHGRMVGVAAAGIAGGTLNPVARSQHAQAVGAYRNSLALAVTRFHPGETARYNALTSSAEWKLANAGEESLGQTGTLQGVNPTEWLSAEQHVSDELLGLFGDQWTYAANLVHDVGVRLLWQSILAGAGVLILAIAAFVIALRSANFLVRRLQTLRTKTLELARETLPSMVRRLNSGEPVDVDSEMTVVDDGADEIGQVAEAFTAAQRTAVDAAAAEAKTRGGINKVFLDIAHRSQVVVHRQLEVLDVAEAKQSDPEHLELLFKLDHLATRARRNAENLLILGGGQPGRKWRKPVALEEIVRSAISETEGFERVSAVRLPDVQVLGSVVADLVHLLAELVDNAISFSPPDSPVTVRGNLVGKGVVVEVEDQGLGIEFGERERLNETLHNPPAFQEMALAGERNLGLFVIGQLAERHGIGVNLLESAYGGVKAIVLVPSKVLDGEAEPAAQPEDGELVAVAGRGRHHQELTFLPQPAEDPVPRQPMSDTGSFQAREWPNEEPAADAPRPPFMFDGMDKPAPEVRQQPSRQRAPLPRRRRQENLVPQLQLDDQLPAPSNDPAPGTRRARSPEDARSSMSSFQRGTRQARGTSGAQNG